MRSEKKYQFLWPIPAVIGSFALVVACAHDLIGPQADRSADVQPANSVTDTARIPAEADVISSRNSGGEHSSRSGIRMLTPHARHTVEDGTGTADEVYGFDTQDDYGTEGATFHMDPTGTHIDKIWLYHDGEEMYHADLGWSQDATGEYISTITQAMYYEGIRGPQTTNTCGERVCEWREMRMPIGQRLHALMTARFPFLEVGLARDPSFPQGYSCDSQAQSEISQWVGFTAQTYIAYRNQAPPPLPPTGFTHMANCLSYLGSQRVEDAARVIRGFEATILINSWQVGQRIWDRLNRPASAGYYPIGGGSGESMFTRDATSCEVILGRRACISMEQKMHQ